MQRLTIFSGAPIAAIAHMVRYRLRLQVQEYELSPGSTLIGRGDDCNLTIDDPILSREHAVITFRDNRVTLRDLESRNGTMVNGAAITSEVELHHGDRVRLGQQDAIFHRVSATRRDVRATASVRTCDRCQVPYVSKAPSCPHCGEPAKLDGVPRSRRTESQDRNDWWLDLQVSLLEKAISIARHDEADETMQRIGEGVAARHAQKKSFEQQHLEAAQCAALHLACVRGNGAWIAWVLRIIHETKRMPSPAVFAQLAQCPLLLLEEAIEPMQDLVSFGIERTDPMSLQEKSALRSLVALTDEVVDFRLQRWDETPRAQSGLQPIIATTSERQVDAA